MPRGFGPVIGVKPRVLVLGSLPGRDSVLRQQYYAHERNAFWPIMERLFGIDRNMEYECRLEEIVARGIAIWDVLASADREGSLDSAIVAHTEVANDVASLLAANPGISTVILNGSKAAALYRRYVAREVEDRGLFLRVVQVPSTSPANARYDFEHKLEAWSVLAEAVSVPTDAGSKAEGVRSGRDRPRSNRSGSGRTDTLAVPFARPLRTER